MSVISQDEYGSYFYVHIYYEAFIMWIPDYDIDINENMKIRLNRFLDRQSVRGKTNTIILIHMLCKLLVYYDKIYFYTPNQNQEKKIQQMNVG